MNHAESLQQAGLGFIADRIKHHGNDIEQFWNRELFMQPTTAGTMGGALFDWLGQMECEGDLHQRLTTFWERDVPAATPKAKAPLPTSVYRIDPEGRNSPSGAILYSMNELSADGDVIATVPASGLLYDDEGIPVARFRNGLRQFFGHMDMEYRLEQADAV